MISQSEVLHVVADDGARLVGDVTGQGDAAVLLAHGGGQTRHAWRSLTSELARLDNRVIRYDMRGHGDSAWSVTGDYSLPTLAADLHAVAAAAGVRPIIVGASLGGLGAFYATATGLDARALVMVDTAFTPSPQGTERIRSFMAKHVSGFRTLDDAVDAVADFKGVARTTIQASSLARSLRRMPDGWWRWHWDPRFLSQAEDLGGRADLLATIAAQVRAPVLLLRGGESDIVDDAAVEAMRLLVPQLQIITVPGASHMGSTDQNDGYEAAIVKYVAQLV